MLQACQLRYTGTAFNPTSLVYQMISQRQLKFLRSLKHKKYRTGANKFLLEGLRNCEQVLDSNFNVDAIFIGQYFGQNQRQKQLLQAAQAKSIEIFTASERELSSISDTIQTQGVVALVHRQIRPLQLEQILAMHLVLAVEQMNDPGNLGTILRTASWFGVDGVLVGNGSVDVYNPKVVRSSMGAIFHLPIYENVVLKDIIPNLMIRFQILATAPHFGQPLTELQLKKQCLLMIGNEARGLDPNLLQLSDQVVQVPRFGAAESLNVAVATGILLFEFRKRCIHLNGLDHE